MGPENLTPDSGAPIDKDARLWAMLCHLSALLGFTCIPFANLIAPLVIWMVKRETHPFVDDQGKEAVNFQILLSVIGIVIFILSFAGIGIFLGPILGIVLLVFAILAGVKANSGEYYRYPFNWRLVK
ncbi:MAG: DUF4870 domain-containing protein [Candidatus Hydrogenedentota bacterium]